MVSSIPMSLASGLPGEILPAPAGMFASQAARSLTANRAFLLRWQPSEGRRLTRLVFEVTTAASGNDACDVGIYDATTLTRLANAGATLGLLNSVGVKTLALTAPLDVQPDTVYLVAFSCGTLGGTAASINGRGMISATSGTAFCVNPASPSFPDALCAVMDTAHPLPTTLSALGFSGTGTMPVLVPMEN